ncbi:hypothetical protein M0804_007337 [Polistes exclamans]|nr:hypothetical protein M0804_007337 [Polistes exclamans]
MYRNKYTKCPAARANLECVWIQGTPPSHPIPSSTPTLTPSPTSLHHLLRLTCIDKSFSSNSSSSNSKYSKCSSSRSSWSFMEMTFLLRKVDKQLAGISLSWQVFMIANRKPLGQTVKCRELRFYDVIGPREEVPGTNPVTSGYLTTRKILHGLHIPFYPTRTSKGTI